MQKVNNKEKIEKELFNVVYDLGRNEIDADETYGTYQKLLSELRLEILFEASELRRKTDGLLKTF